MMPLAPAAAGAFTLPLPPHYQSQGILAFHRRDPLALAEQVGTDSMRKGMVCEGQPVVLRIDICADTSAGLPAPQARCSFAADAALSGTAQAQLREVAQGLLGLRIAPQPFEAAVRDDPLLGPLARRQQGLRIAQAGTCFEALTWAIIGQQINLPFAIALRRALIELAGVRHSSGLWCYPQAAEVARLDPEALGQLRFSRAKAQTLVRVAQLAHSGVLPLEQLAQRYPLEQMQAILLDIKGVGPWTVNYTLLRGYGMADCSLHGDAAVKTALHRLAAGGAKPDNAQAQAILARYQPFRSMACAHLWASLHAPPPAPAGLAQTGELTPPLQPVALY